VHGNKKESSKEDGQEEKVVSSGIDSITKNWKRITALAKGEGRFS
jgi:hypothetical protein